MRITIIAIGSRGDVQPYIALGQGLIKAGHTVRFVTQQNFEVLVKSYGLEFWPIRGSSQDVAGSQEFGGNYRAAWKTRIASILAFSAYV